MKRSITLSTDWYQTERGNTALSNDDGNLVAWLKLDDEHCLEMAYTSANSPALHVLIADYDPVALRRHVIENLGGWYCHRWNLDGEPPIDRRGYIIGEDDAAEDDRIGSADGSGEDK
jgi:hypothetical protein